MEHTINTAEQARRETNRGNGRRHVRPELIIIMLIVSFIGIATMGMAAWIRSSTGLLEKTIEEDACYLDGVFYIKDKKDFLRFTGYMNRASREDGESAQALSVDAVLMADIDMEADDGYRELKSDDIKIPILRYDGCFDGNGHTINWFADKHWGMFARLDRHATVKNLIIRSENLYLTIEEEDDWLTGIGILCLENYGRIIDCQSAGDVRGEGCYAGCIAGCNYGTIDGCINRATVESVGVGEYGAGGIAGKNEETWTETDGDLDVEAAIRACFNEGNVTGDWMAGGICSKTDGIDTVIDRCGNTGAVSVRYRNVQPWLDSEENENIQNRWEEAKAGGITGEMNGGILSECYNTGRISIQEAGNCGTYGIAGGAWGNSEVVNCVSLTGTAAGHMRHENIMELTPEEMERWLADPAAFPYVYNSWQFDLEEAKEKLGLTPLGISQSAYTKGTDTAYLCDAFCMRAPEGFVIREISPYALCMEAQGDGASTRYGEYGAGYQVWLLRLPEREIADMNAFLQETEELETIYAYASVYNNMKSSLPGALWLASLDDTEVEADISRIWECMEEPDWLHPLDFMNWWDHHTWINNDRYSFLLYKEELNARHFVFVDNDETQRLRLDNIVSLPVRSSAEGEHTVQYLLLFTDRYNNYRPDLAFAEDVLDGFYYLPYQIRVKWGDTLSALSGTYGGKAGRYRELADRNGLEDADLIREGDVLTVPGEWLAAED